MSPALGDAEEQTACFFPRRTPRRTPDFPHGRTAAVRPSQRIPAPRRLRPPSAEFAPTNSSSAAPSPRTAPGTPVPATGRRSPALARSQPTPARPDPPAPSTQVRHTDGRPDGLSRQRPLPAGCPGEPLPGGACRRQACWRCSAAEPWQERGAQRRHAPAAGLGCVRLSVPPSLRASPWG